MEKILVLGSKGMVGIQLLLAFGQRASGWGRNECDVLDAEVLRRKVLDFKPSIIINCTAYNDVDGSEDNSQAAFLLNAEVVRNLSKIANELGIPLLHFSTNYVFDGVAGEYDEASRPNPQSVYAQSKYQGEQNLLQLCNRPYLVRTSVIFGPKGQSEKSKSSFVDIMLDLSKKNGSIKAVTDEVNSVTYAADLAAAVKALVDRGGEFGIYHITNSGCASWYDMAKEIFSITGQNVGVVPVPSSEFLRKAKRPKKAVLLNTKLPTLRSWQQALKEFLANPAN